MNLAEEFARHELAAETAEPGSARTAAKLAMMMCWAMLYGEILNMPDAWGWVPPVPTKP